jgi:hypothetical protein
VAFLCPKANVCISIDPRVNLTTPNTPRISANELEQGVQQLDHHIGVALGEAPEYRALINWFNNNYQPIEKNRCQTRMIALYNL